MSSDKLEGVNKNENCPLTNTSAPLDEPDRPHKEEPETPKQEPDRPKQKGKKASPPQGAAGHNMCGLRAPRQRGLKKSHPGCR